MLSLKGRMDLWVSYHCVVKILVAYLYTRSRWQWKPKIGDCLKKVWTFLLMWYFWNNHNNWAKLFSWLGASRKGQSGVVCIALSILEHCAQWATLIQYKIWEFYWNFKWKCLFKIHQLSHLTSIKIYKIITIKPYSWRAFPIVPSTKSCLHGVHWLDFFWSKHLTSLYEQIPFSLPMNMQNLTSEQK